MWLGFFNSSLEEMKRFHEVIKLDAEIVLCFIDFFLLFLERYPFYYGWDIIAKINYFYFRNSSYSGKFIILQNFTVLWVICGLHTKQKNHLINTINLIYHFTKFWKRKSVCEITLTHIFQWRPRFLCFDLSYLLASVWYAYMR